MPRHVFYLWGDETAENDDDDSERGNEEENDARLVNFVNNFVASAIVRICWVAEQIVWHNQSYFLRACNKFQTKEIIQILQAIDFWNCVASPPAYCRLPPGRRFVDNLLLLRQGKATH